MAMQNDSLAKIADTVGEIADLVRSIARTAVSGRPQMRPAAVATGLTAGGGSGGMVGRAVANPAAALAAATRGFVGAAAVAAAALQQIGGAVQGFVGAISPAAVMQFQLAMHNLSAALGALFKPILDMATTLARQFNATLTPAIEKLQPVITQLAQAFGSVVTVWVGAFASVLKSLMPAFKFFADLVSAIAPLFQSLYAGIAGFASVIAGLVKTLLAGFGVDTGDLMDTFKDAVRLLADGLLIMTAAILSFVDSIYGSTMGKDFAKGATEALGEGERRGTVGAARNAQIGGIADFGNVVARNALLAGVGGATPEDQAKAQREKLIERLNAIAASAGSAEKTLKELLKQHAQMIIDGTTGKVYEKAQNAAIGAAIGTLLLPGAGTVIGGIAGVKR